MQVLSHLEDTKMRRGEMVCTYGFCYLCV